MSGAHMLAVLGRLVVDGAMLVQDVHGPVRPHPYPFTRCALLLIRTTLYTLCLLRCKDGAMVGTS